MYLIKDCQNVGRYFGDGIKFKNKKEVVDQLISYHDNDFTGTDNKENELPLAVYLKFWDIKTIKDQLDWLLDYGMWELEKV